MTRYFRTSRNRCLFTGRAGLFFVHVDIGLMPPPSVSRRGNSSGSLAIASECSERFRGTIRNVSNPTGESSNPIRESRNPTGETGNPIGESGNPIGESGIPIGESGIPIGESSKPTGESRNPTGESRNLKCNPVGEHNASGSMPGPSMAATLANLLPLCCTNVGNVGDGIYVGDGRPPVPMP